MEPLAPLQRAIYAALAATTEMPAVYDYVPESAAQPGTDGIVAPYVSLGAGWTTAQDPHGSVAFDVGVQLDVWSRYRGMSEANEITDLVYGALHHHDLAVDGFGTVHLWIEGRQTMRDPDPSIRHVALTCRAVMAPISFTFY